MPGTTITISGDSNDSKLVLSSENATINESDVSLSHIELSMNLLETSVETLETSMNSVDSELVSLTNELNRVNRNFTDLNTSISSRVEFGLPFTVNLSKLEDVLAYNNDISKTALVGSSFSFGYERTLGWLNFDSSGQAIGFAADIAYAINKLTGAEIDLIHDPGYQKGISGITDGTFEITGPYGRPPASDLTDIYVSNPIGDVEDSYLWVPSSTSSERQTELNNIIGNSSLTTFEQRVEAMANAGIVIIGLVSYSRDKKLLSTFGTYFSEASGNYIDYTKYDNYVPGMNMFQVLAKINEEGIAADGVLLPNFTSLATRNNAVIINTTGDPLFQVSFHLYASNTVPDELKDVLDLIADYAKSTQKYWISDKSDWDIHVDGSDNFGTPISEIYSKGSEVWYRVMDSPASLYDFDSTITNRLRAHYETRFIEARNTETNI